MHERSPKSSPMDTLLYEFEMLRHCADTVDAKKMRRDKSEKDKAEYYLGIEGFLLHFRNVLGFLINKRMRPTDLTINRPDQWANRQVDEGEHRDLTVRAKEIDSKHGLEHGGDGTSYQKISWFLQHCTMYRHQLPRQWDIAAMFADIEPLLNEFASRFAPAAARAKVASAMLGRESHNTATVMRGSLLMPHS